MRLSDRDIQARLASGTLGIEPLPEDVAFGPASVDLRLGREFCQPLGGKHPVEAGKANPRAETSLVEDGAFILAPGGFALGITVERLRLPDDVVGHLDGRSSLARIGLMIHATAHTIHPGWEGPIVFEFFNAGPCAIALRPGERICAVAFETLSSPAARPYGSRRADRYAGRDGLPASVVQSNQGETK